MKYGRDYSVDIQILTEANEQYVSDFHCGNPSIDLYFQMQASTDRTSVTYLFVDDESDSLIGCVTVACSAIFTKRASDYQYSTLLSAMEIKYLATAEQYQHIPYSSEEDTQSLSDVIFDYMLLQMEDISHTKIGASKIVLYSVPTAVSFYEKHGFKEFGDAMYGDEGDYLEGCKPMYFDMN